jgi:hypothetical protein
MATTVRKRPSAIKKKAATKLVRMSKLVRALDTIRIPRRTKMDLFRNDERRWQFSE